MPLITALSTTTRMVVLLTVVFSLFTGPLHADDSPLLISVGVPASLDDQNYLSGLQTQPDIPCLIHIKNLSDQAITLPNFNREAAPLTIKTSSTWVSSPKFSVPSAQPDNLVIKPGETAIVSRDLETLTRFQMFGTYPIQYTFDTDYTFFPLTGANTPPSAYTSHHITETGSFDVPISIGQSTWGWPIILAIIAVCVVLFLFVVFLILNRAPKRRNNSWSTEFSLSDSLENDKE